MTKLINRHNKSATPRPSSYLTPGCTTCGTCTPPRCSWRASLSTSSPLASAAPTPSSPCVCTLTSSASTRQESETSSPRPSTARVSKTVSKAPRPERTRAAFPLLLGGQGQGRTADLPLSGVADVLVSAIPAAYSPADACRWLRMRADVAVTVAVTSQLVPRVGYSTASAAARIATRQRDSTSTRSAATSAIPTVT
jgi:hypothetical protein